MKWEHEATKLVRLLLEREQLSLSDLRKLFEANATFIAQSTWYEKVERGKFSLAFFLEILHVIGCNFSIGHSQGAKSAFKKATTHYRLQQDDALTVYRYWKRTFNCRHEKASITDIIVVLSALQALRVEECLAIIRGAAYHHKFDTLGDIIILYRIFHDEESIEKYRKVCYKHEKHLNMSTPDIIVEN